jgi:hypothetical protein
MPKIDKVLLLFQIGSIPTRLQGTPLNQKWNPPFNSILKRVRHPRISGAPGPWHGDSLLFPQFQIEEKGVLQRWATEGLGPPGPYPLPDEETVASPPDIRGHLTAERR